MRNTAMDVIYLVSCAANGRTPEKEKVDQMDLEAVYDFAARHMIRAAVACALESAGFKDERFCTALASAIRKTALFDSEWKTISSKLNEACIWYMPLKGAVIKGNYPKYGMREFSDFDILFDASRAGDVKAIMEDMGYTAEHYGTGNHDCYHKKPVLNFEMHRALFGPVHEQKLYEYYEDIEQRLIDHGSVYEKRFSAEDCYLYCIAHEYKHYSFGGTGLRSLLDTYIYLKHHTTLDMTYVAEEAEKLGIREFEEKNRSLSLRLFSGDELTSSEQEMLDYILSSGTYGTITHSVQNGINKKDKSKIRYMIGRFSVPISKKNREYTHYALNYPFFYKHKIFLPVLPFYRTFRSMKAGRFRKEAKALKDAQTRK